MLVLDLADDGCLGFELEPMGSYVDDCIVVVALRCRSPASELTAALKIARQQRNAMRRRGDCRCQALLWT